MIAKIIEIFKMFGILNGVLYLIDASLKRLTANSSYIKKYYILVQPVQAQILSAERGKDIEIIELKKDSLERNNFPRPSSVIDWRYESGSICLAAYKKQIFTAYLWLTKDMYHEDEVRCDYHLYPKGKIFWDYDVYILPKYRFGLTFPKLWDAASSYIRKAAGVATMSRISAFNLVSLRSHKQLGAVQLGSLTFFVFLGIEIMCSTFKPYIYIGINKKSRVQIKLHSPKDILKS